jgi:hypothetical protein
MQGEGEGKAAAGASMFTRRANGNEKNREARMDVCDTCDCE